MQIEHVMRDHTGNAARGLCPRLIVKCTVSSLQSGTRPPISKKYYGHEVEATICTYHSGLLFWPVPLATYQYYLLAYSKWTPYEV